MLTCIWRGREDAEYQRLPTTSPAKKNTRLTAVARPVKVKKLNDQEFGMLVA